MPEPASSAPDHGGRASAAFDEAGAVEAIDAVIFSEMAGQGPQIALRRDPFGRRSELAGREGLTLYRGARSQQRFDAIQPFLPLERAGAIDEGAARPQHVDRGVQQILLHDSKARDI